MSEHMSVVHRSAVCPRCGQVTLHIRGICRMCDPCTTMLIMVAAENSLSAGRTTDLEGIKGVITDGRSTDERQLAA